MTAVPPLTSTGPKYGIELKMPAIRPQTAACCTPSAMNASHVADRDQRAGEQLHGQERFDLPSISRRISSVTFFSDSVGPAIFTSLRRYRSPDASRKKARNRISTACPAAATRPSDPYMTYWLMLIGADSTCTRCTPLRGAGTGAGVAALSSSVAAFCTCSIARWRRRLAVLDDPPQPPRRVGKLLRRWRSPAGAGCRPADPSPPSA